MTVSNVSVPTTSTASTQSAHHSHRSHGKGSASGSASSGSSAAESTAGESLEQLAQEGDPMAMAELNAEKQQPGTAAQTSGLPNMTQQAGAQEPGKGDQIDQYV